MYRVTIEELRPPDKPESYDSWKEIYQQSIEDLDVSLLVMTINSKSDG
jgi:hypothetical protein